MGWLLSRQAGALYMLGSDYGRDLERQLRDTAGKLPQIRCSPKTVSSLRIHSILSEGFNTLTTYQGIDDLGIFLLLFIALC